jgi:hypothetical protein
LRFLSHISGILLPMSTIPHTEMDNHVTLFDVQRLQSPEIGTKNLVNGHEFVIWKEAILKS